MPSSLAVSQTDFGPRSRMSCAYTVLSEDSVARVRLTFPEYESPKVLTSHLP